MKKFVASFNSLAVFCSLPLFAVYFWSDQLVDGRYTAKTFYFSAVLIFLIFSVILLLFGKNHVRIKINKLDLALLAFYLYNFVRILFTPNKPVYNTRFICYTLLLGLYFIWKRLFELQPENRFGLTPGKILLTALLLTGAGQAVWGLLQLYHIIPTPPNIGGFRVFGNFGNPAPYASFLGPFTALSLGLYLLPQKSHKIFDKLMKNLGLLTFLLCLLVLPVTGSRSSWLGALGGCLLILIYRYDLFNRAKMRLNTWWKKSAAILLLLAIVISGSWGLYYFKHDSAYGRLLQWRITVQMIKDRPIFGHGFDSFGLHYNTYQADYFLQGRGTEQEKMVAGNTQQAHNEYLESAAELGILGLLIGMGVVLFVILDITRQGRNNRAYLIVAGSGLICYLIESLFDYPLQVLPSLIIFVFLLSIISAGSGEIARFQIHGMMRAIWALIIVVILVVFAIDQVGNYKLHSKWELANRYSALQWYQKSEKIYAEIAPRLETNGDFLLNYGGTLALDEKYQEAIPLLRKAEKYLNDPNLYISLGNCYKETGNFAESEYYYRKAGAITPHQMYPKYLLVQLYKSNGYKENMLKLAKEILEMTVKIQSSAATQIRKEMKALLEENGHNFAPKGEEEIWLK